MQLQDLELKVAIHTGSFITKAQKETLFDYYIFFDRNNEAIELYK